jgi:hypothetical protein
MLHHFLPELRHLNLAPVSKLDIAEVAEAATKMAEPASTAAETATMERRILTIEPKENEKRK